MTSNIGSQHLMGNISEESAKKLIKDELRSYFRVEFLNRIDDIVFFHSLSDGEIQEIVRLLLKDVETRLLGYDIRVTWENALYPQIA
jgi:ATP-dependent Clp protease ATP-binding subunit ClpA